MARTRTRARSYTILTAARDSTTRVWQVLLVGTSFCIVRALVLTLFVRHAAIDRIPHRRRTFRPARAGCRRRGPDRRGRHRALHRALSKGGDRGAGRRTAASAERAPGLPAR